MWAAVLKEQANDLTRIWRVKNEGELSDLKELFLFTFCIVSWRQNFAPQKNRRKKKKNLLHQNVEA